MLNDPNNKTNLHIADLAGQVQRRGTWELFSVGVAQHLLALSVLWRVGSGLLMISQVHQETFVLFARQFVSVLITVLDDRQWLWFAPLICC